MSIIYYFLVDKQVWSKIKDIRVYRGHEIGSDHDLLKAKLWLEKNPISKNMKRSKNEKIRNYKLKKKEIKNNFQWNKIKPARSNW